MLLNEAKWLVNVIGQFDHNDLSPMINIGSGTRAFREIAQPFIENILFSSVTKQNIDVYHFDVKSGDGIDLAGDINDTECRNALRTIGPKSILCSNVIEHVPDPALVSNYLIDLLDPGGLLFVTVPYSFPYHSDPIDTMFRPDKDQLSSLFLRHDILRVEIIPDTSYWFHIRNRPSLLPRNLARLLLPFPDTDRWRSVAHNMLWLFKTYKSTCVVVRKNG